jgi:glycosyltransferase involved in cell wall biosynthesis
MESLLPQITDEIEVILVDDGSDVPYFLESDKVKVIRKENGGVSSARNSGLMASTGEYIAFVDSDDILSDKYIKLVLDAIKDNPDTVYLSWKSIDGRHGKIIQSETDEFNPYNRCVWNRVFKRTYIDGMTFDESMSVAEDDDFLKRLPVPKSKTYIPVPVYFYRSGVKGGLTDRKLNGEFDAVPIPEQNEVPEIITQVVVYCGNTAPIGGVETFIYNFCKEMCQFYDILVLYTDRMDGLQIIRLAEYVQVKRNDGKLIQCNTAINIRLTDVIPKNVRYKELIQMSHTCQLAQSGKWHWTIRKNYNKLVFVSQAAADSFADQKLDYQVIPNLTDPDKTRKSLLLVSACRLTWEKGEERIYELAKQFRSKSIPFVWLVFSNQPLKRVIPGVVHCPATLDVRSYFKKADYVVQLSDIESFCYTLAEALELGIPVLTTPISVLPEIGFKEGKNGYIIPFDVKNVDVEKIYSHIPKFTPLPCRNNEIVKQWRDILGKTTPTHTYTSDLEFLDVVAVENYNDLELKRYVPQGEKLKMRRDRALALISANLVAKA